MWSLGWHEFTAHRKTSLHETQHKSEQSMMDPCSWEPGGEGSCAPSMLLLGAEHSTHQAQNAFVLWNIHSKSHTSIHMYICAHISCCEDHKTYLCSFWSVMQIWCQKDQHWFHESIYLFMCIKGRDCKWNIMVRTVQLKQISYLFGTSVSVFPACWNSYLCFSEQLAEQWDFTPRCWKLHGFRLSHRHAIQTQNVLAITNCIRDCWKNCSISDG